MHATFLSDEASASVRAADQAGDASAFWPRFVLFLRRQATEIRYMRRRALSERALDRLPFDIRKDIGWPEIYLADLNRERGG